MRRFSPYNYAFDNPIRFIDPDGMAPTDDIYKKDGKEIARVKTNDSFDRIITVKRGTVTVDANGGVSVSSDYSDDPKFKTVYHQSSTQDAGISVPGKPQAPTVETKPSVTEPVNEKEPEGKETTNAVETTMKVTDVIAVTKDLTVEGIKGAQKMANAVAGTSNEIVDLAKSNLIKGVTVEGASRIAGGASLIYNAYKLYQKPTVGRGVETLVSAMSLIPGWGWAIGAAYFLGNAITEGVTGKSIQANIDGE